VVDQLNNYTNSHAVKSEVETEIVIHWSVTKYIRIQPFKLIYFLSSRFVNTISLLTVIEIYFQIPPLDTNLNTFTHLQFQEPLPPRSFWRISFHLFLVLPSGLFRSYKNILYTFLSPCGKQAHLRSRFVDVVTVTVHVICSSVSSPSFTSFLLSSLNCVKVLQYDDWYLDELIIFRRFWRRGTKTQN
jgi:hypothetical protein